MKRAIFCILLLTFGALMVCAQTPEAAPVAPVAKATIIGAPEVKTIPAFTAALVMEKASALTPKEGFKAGMDGASQAYGAMMNDGFGKLGVWMKSGGKPMGPCLAFFFEDPSKTPAAGLTCKMGFPVEKGTKGTETVAIEEVPEAISAVVTYKGPYESSGDPWTFIEKWITDNGYVPSGAPSEVYLKGPGDNVPPADFVTEIRQPVMKAPAAEEKK